MIVIIGLGNPGKKFQKTRHNVGFRVVEGFQKENKFSEFKSSKKFKALISKGKFERKKIVLGKPQTFMNESGKSVKSLITYYKLQTTNLWVIHDDIDIPLGKIRISKGRGAGGHKGVESVIEGIGTKNFIRFRIGTKPKPGKPKNIEKFVLQKFNKEEEKIIKKVIKKTVGAIEFSLKERVEKAMSKYNY
jgi:PTH1 family peptidyl-tRNA hydrolase